MAYSLSLVTPGVMTPPNPTAKADALLNAGSLFLHDARRLACWDPATDTVADGAVIGNLVPSAPDAFLRVPVAGDIIYNAGTFGFKLKTSVALGRIELGVGTDYFQSNLTQDYLLISWQTYPAVDPTGHVGFILTKGTSAAYGAVNTPLLAHRYTTAFVFGRFDEAAANPTGSAAIGAPNGLEQLAIARIGSNIHYYKNGAEVSSYALGTPAWTAHSTPLCWGNGGAANQYACPGMTLNRVYGENLTTSGATALSVVEADYENNFPFV